MRMSYDLIPPDPKRMYGEPMADTTLDSDSMPTRSGLLIRLDAGLRLRILDIADGPAYVDEGLSLTEGSHRRRYQ